MPILTEGLAKSGRKREDFEISGGGFLVTGKDDEAVAKLFDWVRYRVAFYGSTPAYWPVFEEHGIGDLGRKLNAMTKAGQWDKIAGEVSDDVVHLFAAVGRHDQIAKAIEARFGGLVNSVSASASSSRPADLPPEPDPGYRAHPDALSSGLTTLRSASLPITSRRMAGASPDGTGSGFSSRKWSARSNGVQPPASTSTSVGST